MKHEIDLPQDVKRGWLLVARRCQSVARTDGLAIITIKVLVDQDGNPRAWLEPVCQKIEPKASSSQILEIFSESGF
jgi:hypothetical protein